MSSPSSLPLVQVVVSQHATVGDAKCGKEKVQQDVVGKGRQMFRASAVDIGIRRIRQRHRDGLYSRRSIPAGKFTERRRQVDLVSRTGRAARLQLVQFFPSKRRVRIPDPRRARRKMGKRQRFGRRAKRDLICSREAEQVAVHVLIAQRLQQRRLDHQRRVFGLPERPALAPGVISGFGWHDRSAPAQGHRVAEIGK
jgi:hypothetical protein